MGEPDFAKKPPASGPVPGPFQPPKQSAAPVDVGGAAGGLAGILGAGSRVLGGALNPFAALPLFGGMFHDNKADNKPDHKPDTKADN